jgi:peptide/nickel transport system permease protein
VLKYVIRRLLMLIPTIIGVSFVTFLVVHITPGDPAELILRERLDGDPPREAVEQLREEMGLNDPFLIQYGTWFMRVIEGDLGDSFRTKRSVISELTVRIPATLELAVVSMIISLMIAIPIGVISAVKHNTLIDKMSMLGTMVGISIPNFWLAYLLIMLFSLQLGIFPVAGYGGMKYLILPALTLGAGMAAFVARLMRTAMLEVMNQDYVRTARAKGLTERIVITRHVFRNALVPVTTFVGMQFCWALEGSVIVEAIFARPGVGRFLYDSVFARDFPSVQGSVLFFALTVVSINLMVDSIYSYLDPRIKKEGGRWSNR